MLKRLTYLLPLLLLLSSCFVQRRIESRKMNRALMEGKFINPDGCIEVGPNFYVDKTEASNFNWLEYEYWTNRVFGKDTPELTATQVEESNWLPENGCLAEYYLRHPMFRYYPVVNITPEQAIRYAQWRSDRVFEYYLIRTGRLEWNVDQEEYNHFSTEYYFAGVYLDSMPDPAVMYYPEFHLVTLEEAARIEAYNDSLTALKGNRFITRKRQLRKDEDEGCQPLDKRLQLMSDVNANCRLKKGDYICNFDTNVSEWRVDPDHDAEMCCAVTGDTISYGAVSAPTIGFRMVCEWKKRQ